MTLQFTRYTKMHIKQESRCPILPQKEDIQSHTEVTSEPSHTDWMIHSACNIATFDSKSCQNWNFPKAWMTDFSDGWRNNIEPREISAAH